MVNFDQETNTIAIVVAFHPSFGRFSAVSFVYVALHAILTSITCIVKAVNCAGVEMQARSAIILSIPK